MENEFEGDETRLITEEQRKKLYRNSINKYGGLNEGKQSRET